MSSASVNPAVVDVVREARLHERVAAMTAADIVGGRLAPGDSFPSTEEVVARFSVSRTVAREALQTLSMLGLVRVQHGKRTEVRPPQDWNILSSVVQEALRREDQLEPVWRDLYEFRLLVEPQAAAWMAKRGSDADLVQLSALAAEMRELSTAVENRQRVLVADQAFHKLIAQAATNRVLAGVSRSFWDAVSVLWLESVLSAEELRTVADQHQRIADAITRRDASGAARAMENHLKAASAMDVGQFSPTASIESA